ncbi:MAG: 3-isopropylmalate dehydratase, small subunit [Rhizobacter sp.]|nr:3-isopropylmalate dehydratase, small subunit [Rhizobacter sp.]
MDADVITGTIARLGDYVSADVILPARHSFLPPVQMAEQVLFELGPRINQSVRKHPVIVAGLAFGYGTGRESPVRALRASGVRAVIAKSFSRMFYRNAINNGILVLQCPELVDTDIAEGDTLQIDLRRGFVTYSSLSLRVPSVPDAVARILQAGSLVDYGRHLLAEREQQAQPTQQAQAAPVR